MVTIGLDTSGLDLGFKSHAQRGIGRYVAELSRYFENNPDPQIHIAPFDHKTIHSPRVIEALIERLPAGKNTVKQQLVYPLQLKSHTRKFDILHFPAHMDAPSWNAKRFMLTVLDLIPLVCADLYKADRPGWRYKLARWLEVRAIKSADLILAISQNTARDVQRLLGIPEERIVVTPLGVDRRFFEASLLPHEEIELRRRLAIPAQAPVVLYVGGIDPRKNMSGLLRVFSLVLGACRDAQEELPVLVISGGIQSDREYPKLISLIGQLGLADNVVLPGYVAEADLLRLYALSAVFYFPSLYEGFGLPPLEAMAAGTPVVSSNTSSMPEVLSGGAVLVDPADCDAATREILAVLRNKEHAASLRAKGRQTARLFSWERTGRATLEAYRKGAALAHAL